MQLDQGSNRLSPAACLPAWFWRLSRCFGSATHFPVFWTLPSLLLTQAAAAGSIGLINSIGNLGGFLGPHMLGQIKKATGSFVGGLYFLAVSMFLSAILLFLLGLGKRSQSQHRSLAVEAPEPKESEP